MSPDGGHGRSEGPGQRFEDAVPAEVRRGSLAEPTALLAEVRGARHGGHECPPALWIVSSAADRIAVAIQAPTRSLSSDRSRLRIAVS